MVTIVVAVAAVLAIKAWVVNPYRIPSSSMEPALHCATSPADAGCQAGTSDRVLANRFVYHFSDPDRGEVVVFETPPEADEICPGPGGVFVKRLIGLPGDRLEGREGAVYLNGELLAEPYVAGGDTGRAFDPVVVPEGHYFMMGDNRASSCDSRDWGPVPRENLIGPVFALYWPPQRIGFR